MRPASPVERNTMIIDQRTYTAYPGKLAKWIRLYEEKALPLQLKYLGELIGFFQTEVGPLNQVVHIWKYDSMGDRERRRAAMMADPAWQDFLKESEALGALHTQENKILSPVSFSPLK
jgi:hypothetical protein